ncbi:MAG: hypothetical protein FK732_12945 [Asgard group archaeon]|nr:hypothetical protein [Asgard group archaeon]
MDTPTLRILDVTSSYLDKSFSINHLTERIREIYGTGHYVNIYRKLHDLEKQGILNINKFGRSSIIKLNFQNYILIDLLAEIEIKKKIEFLKEKTDLQMFLAEMSSHLSDFCSIESISSINPLKNAKLNKIELLFLQRDLKEELFFDEETIKIYTIMQKLQNKYNLRIDCLILDKTDFINLLESDEINPLKEILSNKITLFCPQAFWNEFREIEKRRISTKTGAIEIKPAEINETNITYNLARFGYREFGSKVKQGQEICIEYIIIALLMQGDARRIEAIPTILAKHKANANLLVFLARRFGKAEKLFGLLKILVTIKPSEEITKAIRFFEVLNIKEKKANKQTIFEKMRLYDAA